MACEGGVCVRVCGIGRERARIRMEGGRESWAAPLDGGMLTFPRSWTSCMTPPARRMCARRSASSTDMRSRSASVNTRPAPGFEPPADVAAPPRWWVRGGVWGWGLLGPPTSPPPSSSSSPSFTRWVSARAAASGVPTTVEASRPTNPSTSPSIASSGPQLARTFVATASASAACCCAAGEPAERRRTSAVRGAAAFIKCSASDARVRGSERSSRRSRAAPSSCSGTWLCVRSERTGGTPPAAAIAMQPSRPPARCHSSRAAACCVSLAPLAISSTSGGMPCERAISP
jgi:hypothetical protein